MNKHLSFSILALAVLSLAACTVKETGPVSPAREMTITATREDAPLSRTVIADNGTSVLWSPEDRINVFYGPGNTPALFTGQNSSAAATATFTGTLGADESLGLMFYGIYPATDDNAVGDDGAITLTLRSSQTAMAGTFEPDLFPSVAAAEGRNLTFRNVAGGIKFSVADETVTEVVFSGNGSEAIAGTVKVVLDNGMPKVQSVVSGETSVSVAAPTGGFQADEWYYAVLLPGKLNSGITVTLKHESSADVELVSSGAKEVKRGIFGKIGVLEAPAEEGPVERVWGKYSTSSVFWNQYFGGTPGSDRNVTMDDDYIYIAEANKTKNLWALKIADGSLYKKLPTTTVKEEGTFWLSCPRVINLDGDPTLTVCSMSEDVWEVPIYLYVYENGINSEPTAVKMTAWKGGRMGDTFTFWGASATNSVDGQGLTKGMLYFDSMFSSDGIRIWKTQWTKGSLPVTDPAGEDWHEYAKQPQVRYGFDNANTCLGSFWPYPANKDAGIWGGRNFEAKSVYGSVKAGAPNLWSATGDQLDNTVATPIEDGYYRSVPAYQYFDFKGKRYIAYAKQVSNADGRLIIMQGETTDTWEAIMDAHNVIYQGSIQSDAGFFDGDYHPEMDTVVDFNYDDERTTWNYAMDLCIRVMDDCVYIVCLKQNVGLSLFKLK